MFSQRLIASDGNWPLVSPAGEGGQHQQGEIFMYWRTVIVVEGARWTPDNVEKGRGEEVESRSTLSTNRR